MESDFAKSDNDKKVVVSYEDYCDLVSVEHECNTRADHMNRTKEEIKKLETEVEKLKMEAQWCFDERGNRIIATAEQQALEISQKIMEHPQLMEDIVKALRMKKLDLQTNLSALQQKCEELEAASNQ